MRESWESRWQDYYKTLQVDPSAEQEVIKGAYEKLAKKYHPDVNKAPSASERMKELNQAYEILSDETKRANYDLEWRRRQDTRATKKSDSYRKIKPWIEPQQIRFDNIRKGEIRGASLIIHNAGNFKHISFSHFESLLKVVRYSRIEGSPSDIKVDIQVKGLEWGSKYIDYITIKLDQIILKVVVEFSTVEKPQRTEAKPVARSRRSTFLLALVKIFLSDVMILAIFEAIYTPLMLITKRVVVERDILIFLFSDIAVLIITIFLLRRPVFKNISLNFITILGVTGFLFLVGYTIAVIVNSIIT